MCIYYMDNKRMHVPMYVQLWSVHNLGFRRSFCADMGMDMGMYGAPLFALIWLMI